MLCLSALFAAGPCAGEGCLQQQNGRDHTVVEQSGAGEAEVGGCRAGLELPHPTCVSPALQGIWGHLLTCPWGTRSASVAQSSKIWLKKGVLFCCQTGPCHGSDCSAVDVIHAQGCSLEEFPLCLGSISGSHMAHGHACWGLPVCSCGIPGCSLFLGSLNCIYLWLPEICFYVRFPYHLSVRWTLQCLLSWLSSSSSPSALSSAQLPVFILLMAVSALSAFLPH